MFARRMFTVGLVAGFCLLSACREKPHPGPATTSASVARAQALTSRPAWLHQHMPAHALAYVRLPSAWTLAGATPMGRPLDRAVTGRQSLAVIRLLRGSADHPNPDIGALAPLASVFLARLDSPLEAVFIDPTGLPTPNAQVLVLGRLNVTGQKQVDALFNRLPKTELQLADPLDRAGNGALKNGARVHFDAGSGRLFVLAGRQPATPAQMASVLASLGKQAVPASMARLEPQIDGSGQDLFVWIRLKGMAAAVASGLPQALSGALPGNLLEHADAVAFGAGSVQGHGRIRIALSAPGARVLDYLAPRVDTDGLKAVGKLRWTFTLALPNAEQVQRFEQNVNRDLGARGAQVVRILTARLKAAGLPGPQELSRWLGPELVAFGDSSGTYTALRVRDVDAFHAALERLAHRYHWRMGVARSGNARVHWLSASSPLSARMGKDQSGSDQHFGKALAEAVMQPRVHLFWSEEGHWLIFAQVPQALADRAEKGAHASVADWLHARDYPAFTWIGATAINRDAQRQAYYNYIQALLFLGDVLHQPVNIMPLPSASRLGLPEDGFIGGGLTITPDTMGLELDYSQSPAELLQGRSTTSGIAVMAVLAAIAIPQYQQYLVKARFNEALTVADALKRPVEGYLERTGRCPTPGQAGLARADQYAGRYVAAAQAGGHAPHCTIRVQFRNAPTAPAVLAGKTVLFTASRHGQGLVWTCRAPSIDNKYKPASCRSP